MRGRAAIAVIALLFSVSASHAADWFRWHWQNLSCGGDCSVLVFAGPNVNTGMQRIFTRGIPAWSWNYLDGGFVGGAVARRVATLFGSIDIEPELGVGKRFGNAHETEIWAAIYVRFTSFPWNHLVYTTAALSTGLNYASGVPVIEQVRAGTVRPQGDRLLHYFSPELTFALPDRRNIEAVIRFHHRSGGYGAVSQVKGGLQYLTFGARFRF